jgi:tRNA-splicing ligase RtcB
VLAVNSETIETILARLLGVLLGRGALRGGDRPRVRLSVPNEGAQRLLEDLRRFGVSPSVRRGKRWTSVESRDARLLSALAVAGASPGTGRIPGWVFEDPSAARELLSGLYSVRGEVLGFDGGRPRPVRLELRARADREGGLLFLALDVLRLLNSLGVGAEVVGLSPVSSGRYRYARMEVLVRGRRDLLRFLSRVRFRYNPREEERARLVLGELARREARLSARWPARWNGAARLAGDRGAGVVVGTRLGFELAGPEGQRVLTPGGERRLGDLEPGDRVVLYPVEVPPAVDRRGVLLSDVGASGGARGFLRDLGLLPLRWEDPAVPALARIVGYAVGDGHLERDVVKFYGESAGLRWLERDLGTLGLSPVRYEYEDRDAVEVAVHSEGFAALLRELGVPEGRKAGRVVVPGWVRQGPRRVVLEFLAGLFGADGHVSISRDRVSVGLTQVSPVEAPPRLLGDVNRLVEDELGARMTIFENRSYETSEGERRWLFRLELRGKRAGRFLTRVPFEYSLRKRARGLWAGAFLRYRSRGGGGSFERFVRERCLPGGRVVDRVVDVERR